MLVFKRVREALGLNECRHMAVGAAPIHREVLEYFMGVNMPILELYGMSENTGPQTISVQSATHWRTGSCGKNMNGVETKIDKPDENGDGEVMNIAIFVTCIDIVCRFCSVGDMFSWATLV